MIDDVGVCDAALAQVYARGHAATLTNPGSDIEQHQVLVRELPGSRVQMQYGQDDVRYADIELRRSQLAAEPVKDARVEILDGPQTGIWTVLGIERRDDLVVVVRAKLSGRANAALGGARQVQR